MDISRIEFDDRTLEQLQAKANAAGQAVIRQVNEEMSGQPTGQVAAVLRTRLRAAGMEPDEAGVRAYAQEIAAGTLTE